jgi:hypothetical protein
MRRARATAFTVLALLALLIPSAAVPAVRGRIGDPRLLDALYQILVFEYDSPGDAPWGWELAQLMDQEALSTISGLTSVGAVCLGQPAERVLLSRETIAGNAAIQGAAVVIWGEFYEAGDVVYVHSHLRLLPSAAGIPESAGLRETVTVAEQEIRAEPPTDQVNFSPVEIPRATLAALHQAYEQSVTLRAEPSPSARPVGELSLRRPYGIAEVRGEWMKVYMAEGPPGWVPYRPLESAAGLKSTRAIVLYAQGALQFYSGAYRAAQRSFEDYLAHYGAGQDPMNLALARIFLGTAMLRSGDPTASAPDSSAEREYAQAGDLLPSSPAPANYLAVASLRRIEARAPSPADTVRGAGMEIQAVEQRLLHAVKETSDPLAARNLSALYRISLSRPLLWGPGPPSAQQRSAAERQIGVLRSMR